MKKKNMKAKDREKKGDTAYKPSLACVKASDGCYLKCNMPIVEEKEVQTVGMDQRMN